jgi:hypothetical protein
VSPNELDLSAGFAPAKAAGFVNRRIGDETIIVPLSAGVGHLDSIFTLNGVGSTIWNALDGTTTMAGLAEIVAREYAVEAPAALTDVVEFVRTLAATGLIVSGQDAEASAP